MSVKVMGLVWDHYPEGGGELLTALKLADHADHIGDRIWPGVASLARQTRQSERTVQRHLQAMLDSGWLVRVEAGGKGPAHTTRYRMPIEAIPQGSVGRVTKLHPKQTMERVTPSAKKGDIHDKKGDTAMSPEPSLKATVKEPSGAGQAKASPVAACFEAYRHGIKTVHGADYPPSASANGMLAQVVKKLGADPALQVVRAYVASTKPFYLQRKHDLAILAKDAPTIWIEIQQRAGGGAGAPPATKAEVAVLNAAGEVNRTLGDYPVGDPLAIAKKAYADFRSRFAGWPTARYIGVRQGSKATKFSLEELRA